MATYTDIIENTNVPVNDNIDKELTPDEKQRKFFGNYYKKVGSVDPAQFDIVRGFLLGKKFEESVVDNLTISLLEVAKEQELNPTDMVKQLDEIDGKLKLNTLLCILLNTTRNRTSIIGFNQTKTINANILRTVLA